MSMAKKLQLPTGRKIRLINPPRGFKIDAPVSDREAEAILLFAADSKTLERLGGPVFEAARMDKLAWVAYPKAGKLDTDLNRDKLSEIVKPQRIQPVRLVSLDETWSAMRFRPG
jgi:hypothetical protein